jgi:hemolysin activation/secretion protein
MRIPAVNRKIMAALRFSAFLAGLNLTSVFAAEVAATPTNPATAATTKPEPAKTNPDLNTQATATKPSTKPDEPEASFDLLELRVKGNTTLETKVIERTVYPYLGTDKKIETVEKARSALEQAYRNKGYQTVIVDIPEQNVENGVVTLQVVEGKVSRLRVTDSRYFSLGKIKAGVPELAEGKVPNIPVMQKELETLSGQSEDRTVTPVLRAGDTPGTLEVDLKVKDKLPLHGRIELNGRNTSSTSRLRLVSSLHYDNLWQKMHSASLMYQVSPINNKEVDVWAGTYAMPIPYTDAKLALYAVSSSSNAQVANAGVTNVIGIGEIYGLRLIKPLPGVDTYSHSLTLGADYKNFKENIGLIGADNPISTPISYLPFMVQYSSSLLNKTSRASFNVGVNFHVRGLFDGPITYDKAPDGTLTPQTQFERKRSGAKPNYVYLRTDANFVQDLPLDMEFSSRISAQVADSPLISNEQFSMGGMQSIRGYFETQALVDDGFTGSLEVRSPRLAPIGMDYINKLQAIIFVDGGMGWVQQALPRSPKSYNLASVGLGLRFQVWKYFTGILDLGFPLLSLGPVKSGDPKLHFSIATEF